MCGLLGWISPGLSGSAADHDALRPGLAALASRGPDGRRIHGGSGWAAGHTRLAILDLSDSAAQPMTDGRGHWLVFNGEVYNFRELRAELEAKGHQFRSSGDAEVVLHALIEWDVAALAKFVGMFAVAYVAEASRTLLLARDRFGVKPLCYAATAQALRFASTLTAIRTMPGVPSEIDADAALLFMALGFVPSPRSIIAGVRKVRPGHFIRARWDAGGVSQWSEHSYWSIASVPPAEADEGKAGNGSEIQEEFESRVREAVKSRLVSDVPVGSLLSGGLDSSLVTATARRLHPDIPSFTMGFDDTVTDERPFARHVADLLGGHHHEFQIDHDYAVTVAGQLAAVYDEPFADSSAVPMIGLSRGVAHHVKVALSGDGGDETLAGYPWHRALHRAERTAHQFAAAPLLARLVRPFLKARRYHLGVLAQPNRIQRWSALRIGLDEKQTRYLPIDIDDAAGRLLDYFQEPSTLLRTSTDPIDWACRMDLLTYLPDDLMVKADRASMSCGLELREPLLDQQLVTWLLQLPVNLRYDRTARTGKLPTRAWLARHVSRDIVNRPKQGFTPPLARWLDGPLRELSRRAITALERGELAPLKLPENCRTWVQCAATLNDTFRQFEWRVVCFHLWHQAFHHNAHA